MSEAPKSEVLAERTKSTTSHSASEPPEILIVSPNTCFAARMLEKIEEQEPGSICSCIFRVRRAYPTQRRPEQPALCRGSPSLLPTLRSNFQHGCPGGYVLLPADKETPCESVSELHIQDVLHLFSLDGFSGSVNQANVNLLSAQLGPDSLHLLLYFLRGRILFFPWQKHFPSPLEKAFHWKAWSSRKWFALGVTEIKSAW